MKTYQYQLLRYIHDQVTGEFVNIGIVVYQPETTFLQGRFITRYGRISQFYSEINGSYLLQSLRHIDLELKQVKQSFSELFTNFSSLKEITSKILPEDDSALQFSELKSGIDISPVSALNDLYERMVERYEQNTKQDFHDDNWVWRKVYKQYFDKLEISARLKQHTITTANDTIDFDKAWKNGKWNVFQSLSFDLVHSDSVKNKVYKWSGILNELERSQQNVNLYFLTSGIHRHKNLNKFISESLINTSLHTIKVKLVKEDEAEEFAKFIQKEIESFT